MRVSNSSDRHASTAVLVGVVIFVSAAATHLSIASTYSTVAAEMSEKLDRYPDGGSGLEFAVTRVLTSDEWGKPPHVIAQEILLAAGSANDLQMTAIGRALAALARTLVATDPTESRAISAAVADVRNSALQNSFKSARGHREPGLIVPSGNDGSRLETTSPS